MPELKKVYLNIPTELLKEVDSFVGTGKVYANRTELIRDSIRKNLEELKEGQGK